MKKIFSSLCLYGAALSLTTSAYAMPADFVGTWENINPASRGIVRVDIAADMSMRMWGACTPTPCDNGVAKLLTYGRTVGDLNHRAAVAHYWFAFKDTGVVLKLSGQQTMNLEHYNRFTDGSGRQNYYMAERLRKVSDLNSNVDSAVLNME